MDPPTDPIWMVLATIVLLLFLEAMKPGFLNPIIVIAKRAHQALSICTSKKQPHYSRIVSTTKQERLQ